MKVDTTDFSKINMKELFSQIEEWMEKFYTNPLRLPCHFPLENLHGIGNRINVTASTSLQSEILRLKITVTSPASRREFQHAVIRIRDSFFIVYRISRLPDFLLDLRIL